MTTSSFINQRMGNGKLHVFLAQAKVLSVVWGCDTPKLTQEKQQ